MSYSAVLLSRIDTTLLYAPFLEALQAVLEDCHFAGDDFYVTWGYRSPAASDHLALSAIQAAPGWFSAHNYGLAADVCHDADPQTPGLQPDWLPAAYTRMGRIARLHGLVWGGDWAHPDIDHIQWPGYVTAGELAPLRIAFGHTSAIPDGLRSVWAAVEAAK